MRQFIIQLKFDFSVILTYICTTFYKQAPKKAEYLNFCILPFVIQ